MSVIGIDLGTSNSRVAVYRGGLIEVVQDEQHGRKISSCVAFTTEERLIGRVAKQQITKNPRNTIYGSKRLIGRSHIEVEQLKSVEGLPFDLENCKGKPKIRVQYRGQTKQLYPEEISAMVLSRLKDIASKKVKVSGAVITVPTSFNIAQRKATCDAANIAGIKVLGLINETTAVALAYRLRDQKEFVARNALILHVGVGTFDVSVITIDKRSLKVKASIGNSHLGGENFTLQLFDKFCQEYQIDVKSNPADACKLRIACEELKSGLGDSNKTSVDVVINKRRIELTLTRETFREQTIHFLRQIYRTVQQAMHDAHINEQQIDDVLIAGGSAGMPMLTEMMGKLGFESKVRAVDMDEDAAYGAAAWAALISQEEGFSWKGFAIQDILSQSLGTIGSAGPYFRCGSSIPHEYCMQWSWKVGHYEPKLINEERFMNENVLKRRCVIGKIDIDATSNESAAKCRLLIDKSGLLTITSTPPRSRMELNVGISIGEIEQSSREAEIYRADDKRREGVMKTLYDLEREADRFHSKCEEILRWCREVTDPSHEEIEKNRTALSDIRDNPTRTRKNDALKQTEDASASVKQARQESDTTLSHYQENNSESGVFNFFKTFVGFGPVDPHSPASSQESVRQLRDAKKTLQGALRKKDCEFTEINKKLKQMQVTVCELRKTKETLEGALVMKDCELREANKKLKEMQDISLKQKQLEASNAKLMEEQTLLQVENGDLQRDFAEAEKKIKELMKAGRDSKKDKRKPSEESQTLKSRKKEDDRQWKMTQNSKTETEKQKLKKENERLQTENKKLQIFQDDQRRVNEENELLKQENENLKILKAMAEKRQSDVSQSTRWLGVESRSRTPGRGEYMMQRNTAWRDQDASSLSKLCDRYIASHAISKPSRFENTGIHEMSDQKLTIYWDAPSNATEYILRVSQKYGGPSGRRKIKLAMDIERLTDYQYFVCAENWRGEMESQIYDAKWAPLPTSRTARINTRVSRL